MVGMHIATSFANQEYIMADKPNKAIQENLLTLLCHSDVHGRTVAELVETHLFEGDYRVFAERAVEYWQKHGKAPKVHTPDLVADILSDPKGSRRQAFLDIVRAMAELAENVNHQYVLDQIRKFKRLQEIKEALIRSAERIAAAKELGIEDVEEIWHDISRSRQHQQIDMGVRGNQYEFLIEYLRHRDTEFTIGIPQLDQRFIQPVRGQVMILLAPTGLGKSWFLVHAGAQALLQRKKVLHVTLELSPGAVMQRYYQCHFGASRRGVNPVAVTKLRGKDNQLTSFSQVLTRPKFSMDNSELGMELQARVGDTIFGQRYEKLIIKHFPARSLSIDGLRGYLEELEIVNHFIPDMILFDYFGLVKTDEKNFRISLGRAFEDFRGLASERNVACVTAHQISREGTRAKTANITHVAEDWSLVGTADMVLILTSDEHEREAGVARLFVVKARDEAGNFGLVITNNYSHGQFCTGSRMLDKRYFDLFKRTFLEAAEEEDDET
jgi:replicative DNA helicase